MQNRNSLLPFSMLPLVALMGVSVNAIAATDSAHNAMPDSRSVLLNGIQSKNPVIPDSTSTQQCDGQSFTWTVLDQTCTGLAAAASYGSSTPVINSTPGMAGSARATCTSGNWALQNKTCEAVVNTDPPLVVNNFAGSFAASYDLSRGLMPNAKIKIPDAIYCFNPSGGSVMKFIINRIDTDGLNAKSCIAANGCQSVNGYSSNAHGKQAILYKDESNIFTLAYQYSSTDVTKTIYLGGAVSGSNPTELSNRARKLGDLSCNGIKTNDSKILANINPLHFNANSLLKSYKYDHGENEMSGGSDYYTSYIRAKGLKSFYVVPDTWFFNDKDNMVYMSKGPGTAKKIYDGIETMKKDNLQGKYYNETQNFSNLMSALGVNNGSINAPSLHQMMQLSSDASIIPNMFGSITFKELFEDGRAAPVAVPIFYATGFAD